MSSENNTPDAEVSNWTLATGTRPGERPAYPTVPQDKCAAFIGGGPVMSRSLRTVVVVIGHPQQAELPDALLVETNGYDVVFVESIARGYSRIKQVTPDSVIVVSDIDDVAACQLLTMLEIDDEVSRIPVVRCVTRLAESELEDDVLDLGRDAPYQTLAIPMN